MGRKSTSVMIDSDKLKGRIAMMGYTCKELAVMMHYAPQHLTQCIHKGLMSEECLHKMEELGFKRSWFVIKGGKRV